MVMSPAMIASPMACTSASSSAGTSPSCSWYGATADATVLQRAEIGAAALTVHDDQLGRSEHGLVDLLQNGGQVHLGLVRVGQDAVAVDADDPHAAGLLGVRRGTEAHRTGDREHDVRVLVREARRDVLAVVEVLEVAGERAVGAVPTEQRHLGAVLGVVVLHALEVALHEDGHRRDVDAAVGADHAGLAHAGRQVAGLEGRLRGVEVQGEDVVERLLVPESRRSRTAGPVVRRGLGRRVAEEEADRDDQVTSFLDERLDVRGVVGVRGRLEDLRLEAELLGGPLRALEGELVEAPGRRRHRRR